MIWQKSAFLLIVDTSRLLRIILFSDKVMTISHGLVLVVELVLEILLLISTTKILIERIAAKCRLWLTIQTCSSVLLRILACTRRGIGL